MNAREFAKERLALFSHYGFEGQGRRIADGKGRSTYLIAREIIARETKADRRPLTILFHGGLSQASEWAPLAGALEGRVVIPDRPGHGLSYPIDYRGVDFRRSAVDWVAHVLDSVGAEQADLVGNSIGGFFSIAFAIEHPERVRRLVLIGAAAGLHRELPFFARLWGNALAGQVISRMTITDPETFRKRVLSTLVMAHPERMEPEPLRLMTAAGSLPGVPESSFRMLRRVTTLRGWRREFLLREEAADVRVPTKFIWGDRDAFAPPERGREVAARMPHADFQLVEDAGHVPHFDRPRIVSDSLTGFLSAAQAA